jgi:hypothetical protein
MLNLRNDSGDPSHSDQEETPHADENIPSMDDGSKVDDDKDLALFQIRLTAVIYSTIQNRKQ